MSISTKLASKDQMPTLLYIFQIWEVTDSTTLLIVANMF